MTAPWPKVKLGEVLSERRETPVEGDIETGAIRVLSKIGFADGKIELRQDGETKTGMILVRQGDLVVSGINAAKGAIAIWEQNEDIAATIHYGAYIPNKDRVDVRFLWWLLRSTTFKVLLLEYVPGGIKTELKAKRLLPVPIPLPPLTEQRRIVARIEALAGRIEDAMILRRETILETDATLLSHVGKVFEHLCSKFRVREFGSFSPHVTSGPRNWAKHYEDNGYRFYRAQDIGPSGSVLDDGKVFLSPPPGKQGRIAMLQLGDILIVITGATVGRVNVFREGLEPGFVSQHVAICRMPKEEVDPKYILWGLRGPNGQQQLLGQRYGQGKPGLNLSNIRALSLPFPPVKEQRCIIAELDALQAEVDKLKRFQAESSAVLNAFLPSILAYEFNK